MRRPPPPPLCHPERRPPRPESKDPEASMHGIAPPPEGSGRLPIAARRARIMLMRTFSVGIAASPSRAIYLGVISGLSGASRSIGRKRSRVLPRVTTSRAWSISSNSIVP